MKKRGPYNIKRVSPEELEQARNYVRYSANIIRNRGTTMEHALRLAADVYGLQASRIRKLVLGLDVQLADIVQRFRDHLEQEWTHLQAKSVMVRHEQERIEAGEPVTFEPEPRGVHEVRPTRKYPRLSRKTHPEVVRSRNL